MFLEKWVHCFKVRTNGLQLSETMEAKIGAKSETYTTSQENLMLMLMDIQTGDTMEAAALHILFTKKMFEAIQVVYNYRNLNQF